MKRIKPLTRPNVFRARVHQGVFLSVLGKGLHTAMDRVTEKMGKPSET